MYCQRCGKALQQSDTTCSTCGSPVSLPPPLVGSLERPGIVTLLAALQFIAGTLYAILAIVIVVTSVRKEATMVLVGLALIVLSTLNFLCGHGLWRLRPYGRTIQLVFAWIGLLAFPMGTIISILILLYMYKPGVKVLFSGRTWGQLTPAERQTVSQHQGSGATAVVVAVVCLVIVMMIGIIAAIAIPNLITAIQRGKQKRTVGEMRQISVALESYYKEHGSYPSVSSMRELAATLKPSYLEVCPSEDAWKRELRYASWQEDETSSGSDSYVLASAARDGAWELEDPRMYQEREVPKNDYNADIVVINGQLVQYPAWVVSR